MRRGTYKFVARNTLARWFNRVAPVPHQQYAANPQEFRLHMATVHFGTRGGGFDGPNYGAPTGRRFDYRQRSIRAVIKPERIQWSWTEHAPHDEPFPGQECNGTLYGEWLEL